MAIDERDAQMDAEDQAFYQDEFGERIMGSQDDAAMDDEPMAASDTYESDFRESLDSTDQLGDPKLMDEAEDDYPAEDNRSMGEKIKDKFDDMTGRDKA